MVDFVVGVSFDVDLFYFDYNLIELEGLWSSVKGIEYGFGVGGRVVE